jgi:hypothetical protein
MKPLLLTLPLRLLKLPLRPLPTLLLLRLPTLLPLLTLLLLRLLPMLLLRTLPLPSNSRRASKKADRKVGFLFF